MKVALSVIKFVFVSMMNFFCFLDGAFKHLFGNNDMFKYISLPVRARM